MKAYLNISIIAIIFLSLLNSCKKEVPRTKREMLTGEWESKYMYVKKNTFNNSDSTVIVDVNPDNYKEILNLSTAIVDFKKRGSFTEKYIGVNGDTLFEQQGYWSFVGDSIIMSVYKPLKSQSVLKYHIVIEGDTAKFNSVMDYDGDGSEDDEFKGISIRKISKK
ncbi:MAG: hypothetical protein QNJ57_00805 [Flavobacteriaceae bacterium]|nr:hypothetical protein [Flavobacteriaceae bacterium]